MIRKEPPAWKPDHRRSADRHGLRYPYDLIDAKWALLASIRALVLAGKDIVEIVMPGERTVNIAILKGRLGKARVVVIDERTARTPISHDFVDTAKSHLLHQPVLLRSIGALHTALKDRREPATEMDEDQRSLFVNGPAL